MSDPLENFTVLIDAEHLRQRVAELADGIEADLAAAGAGEREPVLVVVLKGGMVFGVDLLRALNRPIPVAFVSGLREPGGVVMSAEDQALIRGRDLIIADALMDSGGSVRRLRDWLAGFSPRSVRLAVLLHKTVSDPEPIRVDYLGFEVPDLRLVGYGLDEHQRFRGLPAVYSWWAPTPLPKEQGLP